jgi:hypothetical protein
MGFPNANITNFTSGSQHITGTSPVTGEFTAIVCTSDTKFKTLTGNASNVANATLGSAFEFSEGASFIGRFTAIELHSGSVQAYNK